MRFEVQSASYAGFFQSALMIVIEQDTIKLTFL